MFTVLTNSLLCSALLHAWLVATLAHPIPEPRTQTPAPRFVLDTLSSRIGFEADATLGGFRGEARKITGWVETSEPAFADAHGVIEVTAASFRTGIGMRDRHLRETLETQTYPALRFVLDSARVVNADSMGTAWYRLYGQLTVRNVTRALDTVARISSSGDSITTMGRIDTRFTDFEMKPPSRLLGTTKVKNEFTITFHCTFVPESVSATSSDPLVMTVPTLDR